MFWLKLFEQFFAQILSMMFSGQRLVAQSILSKNMYQVIKYIFLLNTD